MPIILAAALLMSGGAALAEGLPGGASSLNETHGNWTVTCAAQPKTVRCAITQAQMNNETRQRVLAIELTATEGGNAAAGTLVLPFGLKLAQGAILSIDERVPLPTVRFSTCLPAGCLVPLTLNRETVTAMRAGTALRIKASANDTGRDLNLSLPLAGFASALARAAQLGGT